MEWVTGTIPRTNYSCNGCLSLVFLPLAALRVIKGLHRYYVTMKKVHSARCRVEKASEEECVFKRIVMPDLNGKANSYLKCFLKIISG